MRRMRRALRLSSEQRPLDVVVAPSGELDEEAQQMDVLVRSKGRKLSDLAAAFVPVVPMPTQAVGKEEKLIGKRPEATEVRTDTGVGVSQGQLLRSRAVKALLAQLVKSGTFVLSSIKREVNAEFYRQTSGQVKLEKPHGLSIGDMFDPFLCVVTLE